MASIESLLNPLPDLRRFPLPSPSLTSSIGTGPSRPHQKRRKVAKDAPIFNKGKIRGELRYPPCEERDEELTKIHREFGIHPMGDIASYPRHIPYNSDKKSFQERTGREFFEVFQYTFKIPGEDKEWIMMWDYNIGLVRITHLFKCNEYSKTTPGKMLNANPGLRDICHSITGGALAAQVKGYWMPFDAAKAVAATFCWKIRYALTPVFGLDFPSLCIHPQDRPHFGHMVIDPSIVRKATETANLYRTWELRSPALSFQLNTNIRPSCSPAERGGGGFAARKQLLLPRSHRKHTDNLSTSTTTSTVSTASSSGYGSPPEYGSDTYCVSPVSPYRNTFTPVNTPRSADVVYNNYNLRMPTPQEVLVSISEKAGMGMRARMEVVSDEDDAETSSTMYSVSSASECHSLDLNDDVRNEDYRDDGCTNANKPMATSASPDANANAETNGKNTRSSSRRGPLFAKEVKAAHALLSLHMQDASGSDGEGSSSSLVGVHHHQQQNHGQGQGQGQKRRRASA